MAWTGTIVKSWLPRWRSVGKKPAHHILVTYDDPAFEGELFEHNVQESVIDILSTGHSASRDEEIQSEVLPNVQSDVGDDKDTNEVKEDELDDKTRKRLLRIQRQLA